MLANANAQQSETASPDKTLLPEASIASGEALSILDGAVSIKIGEIYHDQHYYYDGGNVVKISVELQNDQVDEWHYALNESLTFSHQHQRYQLTVLDISLEQQVVGLAIESIETGASQ